MEDHNAKVVIFAICLQIAKSQRGYNAIGGECLLLLIPFIVDVVFCNIKLIIIDRRRMNQTIRMRRRDYISPTIKLVKINTAEESR